MLSVALVSLVVETGDKKQCLSLPIPQAEDNSRHQEALCSLLQLSYRNKLNTALLVKGVRVAQSV